MRAPAFAEGSTPGTGTLSLGADALVNALPHPVIGIAGNDRITAANSAAEAFFQAGTSVLRRHALADLVPPASPLVDLISQARARSAPVSEYRVLIGTPRVGGERLVDIYVAPIVESAGSVVVMLHERTIAEKFDRQLTHRAAARSVSGLAELLAHEIKNPLSGIRGAAQLLESTVDENDRGLAALIRDETDRIVGLVDRMGMFSDGRPSARAPVNIHVVLDRAKELARHGFASHVRFVDDYDPSLPLVYGDRDQLIQVFLNLVKNATEAIGSDRRDGEIVLSTAFRPGIRVSVPGNPERIGLPLEFCVRDNGPGVSDEIAASLFDPFVSTKPSGSGLGLALVAKIVGDHGGVIECESLPRRTTFRILMPVYSGPPELARSVQEE